MTSTHLTVRWTEPRREPRHPLCPPGLSLNDWRSSVLEVALVEFDDERETLRPTASIITSPASPGELGSFGPLIDAVLLDPWVIVAGDATEADLLVEMLTEAAKYVDAAPMVVVTATHATPPTWAPTTITRKGVTIHATAFYPKGAA